MSALKISKNGFIANCEISIPISTARLIYKLCHPFQWRILLVVSLPPSSSTLPGYATCSQRPAAVEVMGRQSLGFPMALPTSPWICLTRHLLRRRPHMQTSRSLPMSAALTTDFGKFGVIAAFKAVFLGAPAWSEWRSPYTFS